MALKNSGFTLIELIVVMALIGMASLLAVPLLTNSLDRLSVKSTSKEISATLRKVRSMAISEKKKLGFFLDFEKKKYYVSADSDTEKGKENPKPIFTKKLKVGVEIVGFLLSEEELVSDGVVSIFFYPKGNSSGGTIILKVSGEDETTIIVVRKISGRVQIRMDS